MGDEQEEVVEEQEEQEEPSEEQEESAEEIEEDDEVDEESGLNKKELKEAKYLYGLLKDPKTQSQVIEALAQKAGVKLGSIETKADVKEAKKDIKTLVKEKLGPEFAFVADKLADAMEAVLNEERQLNNEKLGALEATEIERETASALDKLARATNGDSRKVEARMISLMNSIHSSPDLSVYDYLKMLYTIASADRKAAATSRTMADKINRNRTNSSERLSSRPGTGKEGTQTGPQRKGIKAAVEYALKSLEK